MQKGEDSFGYANALRQMEKEAYPGKPLGDVTMMALYINGLRDPEMKRYVRRCNPSTFEEAVEIASRDEADAGPTLPERSRKPRPEMVASVGATTAPQKEETSSTSLTDDDKVQLKERLRRLELRMKHAGKKGPMLCYRCMEPGHLVRDCPYPQSYRPPQENATDQSWLPAWSKEELRDSQEKDPALCQILSWLKESRRPSRNELQDLQHSPEVRAYMGRRNDLVIQEGVLYIDVPLVAPQVQSSLRLVATPAIRRKLFGLLHNAPLGGHLGRAKTLEVISQRFYWPGCRKDVEVWLQQCDDCAQVKPGPKHRPPLVSMRTGGPSDRVSMDIHNSTGCDLDKTMQTCC